MPNNIHFNPVNTEVQQGIHLLEASAGTGKTYAIAMLALRFIVEKELAIDQLLIVTFTKAATKELKERVRARLVEAKYFLAGQGDNVDPNIIHWAEDLYSQTGISHELAIQRLNQALLSIDQAGIFTIHGFCQRLLKEHALESGQMFDVELSDQVDTVREQLIDDFWRTEIYPRKAWEVALLCHEFKTPDALAASLGHLSSHQTILPDCENLECLLQQIQALSLTAQSQLEQQGQSLIEAVKAGYFKKTFTDKFTDLYQALSLWLIAMQSAENNSPRPSDASFSCVTSAVLAKAIRVAHKEKLTFDSATFDELAQQVSKVSVVLRRLLAQTLQEKLDDRLQQLNIMSHDSLITRTEAALLSEAGDLLVSAIKKQYRIALIDEFQDTDQTQWTIFSRLFADSEQSLYLIGDPKQAIYKFRGADIHSYLAAKQQAQQQYTLGHNWRSHPDLVYAINQLFLLHPQPFIFSDLVFNPVTPALTAEQGSLLIGGRSLAPFALWQLAESTEKEGYWTSGKAADALKTAICHEILQLLNTATLAKEQSERALQPADIAILVRTNSQAKLYQDALKEVGIPAVLNSNESVFNSSQATDLLTLLQAIANPSDFQKLKQALTLSWFALNGLQLQQLLNDDNQLSAWLRRFQDYHQLWERKGFMCMMLRLLNAENVHVNIAKNKQAERQITNLQQLLELVQQASLDEHLGLHKTIAWLSSAISQPSNTDEQQLRLESDADAVKIVTMHRSKGLEYPVVFCPYLWLRQNRLKNEKHRLTCHTDAGMITDLGSVDFETHRAIAIEEELAEDLRLMYVALTRAQYRCYLPWVNERSQKQVNNSALAYLLGGTGDFSTLDFSGQQAVLQGLKENAPNSFSYTKIEINDTLQGHYQAVTRHQQLTAHSYKRHLYSAWQMSSYTALSYLSLHDAPELPLDKAEEPHPYMMQTTEQPTLPKGAHTGNVLHDLLEKSRFSSLAQRLDISEQRNATCQRYGLKTEHPEVIDELLYHTVKTPLHPEDNHFCLANLDERCCLKELPFYLRITELETQQINSILQESPTFQPLSNKQMQGFLTGFIDLIFIYQERYYVLDYKSNALNDYQLPNLITAMREHNYGLQYWIYSVVLHRYLQNRLSNYDYAKHFGGVRYLFLRGMQADVAMSGVFSERPDETTLNELMACFT